MLGYQRKYNLTVDGNGTYKMPFTITKDEGYKEFNFSLSKEEFNKITDFAFQILDENGKAINKDGLSHRTGTITADFSGDKDTVTYVLEIIPAFVSKELNANLSVSEITYFGSPNSVEVKNAGKTSLTLYPNNIKYLDFSFSKPEITIPVDADVYGKVYFKSSSSGKTEYELPINFKF
jgi:hypothetical protein